MFSFFQLHVQEYSHGRKHQKHKRLIKIILTFQNIYISFKERNMHTEIKRFVMELFFLPSPFQVNKYGNF